MLVIKKNFIKILQGQTMKENNHPTEQDMQHPLSAAVEQMYSMLVYQHEYSDRKTHSCPTRAQTSNLTVFFDACMGLVACDNSLFFLLFIIFYGEICEISFYIMPTSSIIYDSSYFILLYIQQCIK
jgi:hypothetical protein